MTDEPFRIAGPDTSGVPRERITGRAWIDHLADAHPPSRVQLVKAFFEPGARTVWHRHWRGQIVHVTDGTMIVQQAGGVPVALAVGESLACPPGEWHWHGADAAHFLTQIAVIEVDEDGQDADWGDPVPNELYQPSAAIAIAGRPGSDLKASKETRAATEDIADDSRSR